VTITVTPFDYWTLNSIFDWRYKTCPRRAILSGQELSDGGG
jgi:hypothetical protein